MNSTLRSVLLFAAVVFGLALLVALSVLTTPVQTMLASSYLAEQPGLDSSLGSFSAGLRRVEVADLRLRQDDRILIVPSLEAELPVVPALRRQELRVRRLVARGWTLDLTNRPPARTATLAPRAAVQQAVAAFRLLLQSQQLPCTFTLAAIDLDGEIVLPAAGDREPVRLHVTLSGDAGAQPTLGAFTFTVETRNEDARATIEAAVVRGQGQLVWETPRQVRLTEFDASATIDCRHIGPDRRLTAQVAAHATPAGPQATLTLARGSRSVARLQFEPEAPAAGSRGTWTLDLRDGDLAPFWPASTLPELSASGDGRFSTDPAGADLGLAGTLRAKVGRTDTLDPHWTALGGLTTETRFAATLSDRSLRLETLASTVTGEGISLTAQALQPVLLPLGAGTGGFAPATDGDCLELAVAAFPLQRLVGLPGVRALASGTAAGRLRLATTADSTTLHSLEPLVVHDASVRLGATDLARLDASLALTLRTSAAGWSLVLSPLTLTQGGAELGSVTLEATRPAGAVPVTLRGSYTANLTALCAAANQTRGDSGSGDTANGEFTASLGAHTVIDAHSVFRGTASALAVEAKPHLELYAGGIATFRMPLQIAVGAEQSDLFLEGTRRAAGDAPAQWSLQLAGKSVRWEHLTLAAALLPRPHGPGALPPWGELSGRLRASLDQLNIGATTLTDAAGNFVFSATALALDEGRARLPSGQPAKLTGTVAIDPAAPAPFRLDAVLAIDAVDAEKVLPRPGRDEAPLLEGRFTFSDHLTATAETFAALPSRLQGEVTMTSNAGILRLLKTSVGDTYSEKPKPVADALVNSATAFTSLLGVRSNSIDRGDKNVPKTTAAVFNLTYEVAELGYQKATINAVHAPDGSIRLAELSAVGADYRLTGSGRIEAAAGEPLVRRPLRLTLALTGRNRLGELLLTSGLGAATPEDDGFRRLVPAIELSGSLAALDSSRWHDTLAAALRRPK